MSILVVCPGCRKSFQVSDKFAGKSGPCPQCKTVIKIPEKSQEVKIHAPADFASGGRSIEGKLLLKPESRKVVRFDPVKAVVVGASCLVVLLVTYAAGRAQLWERMAARTIALLVVSPVLVAAAYPPLRDHELEPYRGSEFLIRASICALVYAALWGGFAYVSGPGGYMTGELWNWVVVAPPLLILGTLAAHALLDLEMGNAFFHYAAYVLVTVLLSWVGRMTWLENVVAAP